jgi:tripartite ATP-independent transporter DctP family solute receptor
MFIGLKKRFSLTLAVLSLGAGSMVCSSAWAQASVKKVKVQIAHGASDGFSMHRALVQMKAELEKSGRFDVRIFPSSQMGNDTEMIETVSTGDMDIVVSPSSFFSKYSGTMSFIELPYVFSSRDVAIKVLGGDWGKKALSGLEGQGLVGLGYMENGMRHLTNNKAEVVGPADLKGMKLRTMQVPAHVEFWNLTGASASGSPFAELYTNLSTGVFDGQENPIAQITSQKFNEVQKFMTLTGHVYSAYVVAANKNWWNGLNADSQKALQSAFDGAYAYQLKLINQEEARQMEEMKAKGMKIKSLTPAQMSNWMTLAAPINKKYASTVGQTKYDEFTKSIAAASK